MPDGTSDLRTRRVNPGIPIPPEATAVHGITDEAVADLPRLKHFALGLVAYLDGCDLCGFNIRRYDIKVLLAELHRCGVDFPVRGRHILDAQAIYHQRERRDLSSALKFYCGQDHDGAHGAEADVRATVAVLDAQVVHYEDLPRSVEELHALHADPDALDFDEKFRRGPDGTTLFAFGKYQGHRLSDIAADRYRKDYLDWMLGQDFFEDTKAIIREAQIAARVG